ncbi:MAG: helix-turn-helix domain-containing protein [Pyrinomonadaceae bacterium]
MLKELASALMSEIDSAVQYEDLLNGIEMNTEDDPISLPQRVRDFEVNLIKVAMIKARGNRSTASRLLGLSYTTFLSKLEAFGLDRKNFLE